MFAEERRDIILKKLKTDGRIFVKEIADDFEISIDTVRRDLKILEEIGLLKRTHGGAVALPKVRRLPIDNKLRYSEGTEHQNAIAKIAAEFIEDGDTVFLGGASIHYILLKYLPTNKNFTVVTNCLTTAEKLKTFANIETYIVCGKITGKDEIEDALAIEFIRTLRIDLAFLTGGGITAKHGLSSTTPESAIFQKAVSEISRQKVCLANFDKVGVEYFSKTINTKDLDVLVTDWETSKEEVEKIQKIGVKVIIAN